MKKDLKEIIKAFFVKKQNGVVWSVEQCYVSKVYFTRWNMSVDEERNNKVELIDEEEAIKRGLKL